LKIASRRFSGWDEKTQRNLLNATFEYGFLRRYAMVAPESKTLVAFGNKQIMGWAFIFRFNGKNFLNIFVNQRYRNRGIGAKLIEVGAQQFGKIVLGAWDDMTQHLFKKMKAKYPRKISVINWDNHREKMAKAVIVMFGEEFSFYHLLLLLRKPKI